MESSESTVLLSTKGETDSSRFLEFQRIITSLSSEFINMPLDKLDDAMKAAMALVADFCDASRTSIWTFDRNARVATRIIIWDKHNSAIANDALSFQFSDMSPIIECCIRGDMLHATEKDEFNRRNAEKLKLNMEQYSMSIFPLKIGENMLGFLALVGDKERLLSEIENSTIRILAHMIANVLRRRERELELAQHHENDRLILDAIKEGVVMFDRDGTIININRHLAEQFGGAVEEMIGTNVLNHVNAQQDKEFFSNRKSILIQTYDTGIPQEFEDSRNGLIFSSRCFPVYRNGIVCAVALFTTNITPQRRAMEEATKRAEYQARLKVTTEFFTNISHEFRTPLTLVFNAEKLIEERVQNTPNCENKAFMTKYLGVIRQNIYRLLRLIGNLLDVTKLDAGFMQLHLQKLDIDEWLNMLVASIEAYASNRGLEVTITPHMPVRPVVMDVDKLERIMLNLLSNAIKHTPKGGHIRISLSRSSHNIVLTVEDDGEGIPDDKKEIIFDRFKQVNTSLTRASEGSGIGLALTKLLTELLGGRIWFESMHGRGSIFHVELPVLKIDKKTRTSYIDGMDIYRKVEMEF